MHLLPGILFSLLIDCVQAQLSPIDIQTPKLKAHQTVFQFNSSKADRSAANILADNQCADPSTSDARGSEDVCELSRYKPLDSHPKREISSLAYESHQNAKSDNEVHLTKRIPFLEETKELSAENPPAEDHIALDVQESQFSKNTRESSQSIQARAITTRSRTRPVKHRWKIRPKFRARIPLRKAPSRPSAKTWLTPKNIAPPKTSSTRKVETARTFHSPLKKTRRKSVLWRPKSINRKNSWQKSSRNRPNRSLGPQGRVEKPRKTTDLRRVVKPTNTLSIRRKNKNRKKYSSRRVSKNVPAPLKPIQGASSPLQISPPVTVQPNGIPRNPTSSGDPSNSPPPNLNHVSPPPQPDAIPRNPTSNNHPPNSPPPNLNQASPPLSQTVPSVPSRPNRVQGNSDENVLQDPPASVLNDHALSHPEQENAQPLVTSQDSFHDLEINQPEDELQVGRNQPSRRQRTSRGRPSRSRAIQNYRSAAYSSPPQDEEIMEEANSEEVEEVEDIAREMPSRRAPSNGQSKLFHVSDLLFSTINSALPHLLGNPEMRRTRNPEMEDMANGMMDGNDYPRGMRGPSANDNLYPYQDALDLDPNQAMEESMALGSRRMPTYGGTNLRDTTNTFTPAGKVRPQSGSRSGPFNPLYDEIEEENNGETPEELAPDPRLRHTSKHPAKLRKPHSPISLENRRPDVKFQKTEGVSNMKVSNRANEKSGSKKDDKFAKDLDDDIENTYDEEDDDISEDPSEIDSQADLEPHHDTRTQLNSHSNREGKHKTESKPHHKLSNQTHIEGVSNSTHETNTTINLDVHPDMSIDTDPKINAIANHDINDKSSVDVQTGINTIANHETNHNSSTEAQVEKGHNADHETNLDNISDHKFISNGVIPADNTRDSLSGADGIDIKGSNSTSTSDFKSIDDDKASSKINATELSHGNTTHIIDGKERIEP